MRNVLRALVVVGATFAACAAYRTTRPPTAARTATTEIVGPVDAASPRAPPLVAAGDFSTVLTGCHDATILHLGAETIALAIEKRGKRPLVTIAHWNEARGELDDLQTVGPLDVDHEIDSLEASLLGASTEAATVSLTSGCAPNLESAGGEIECFEVRIVQASGKWHVDGTPGFKRMGAFVEPNHLRRNAKVDPLVRVWLDLHPSCNLNAREQSVPIDGGALVYAHGCPDTSKASILGTKACAECVFFWKPPAGRLTTERLHVAEAFAVEGRGVVAELASESAGAIFVDARGVHPLALPPGTSLWGVDAMGRVWATSDSQVFSSPSSSLPTVSWTPACPTKACRAVTTSLRDPHRLRWVFGLEGDTPTEALRAEGDGTWKAFRLPPAELAFRNPVAVGEVLWIATTVDADRTAWSRLGRASARYQCVSVGPHAFERVAE